MYLNPLTFWEKTEDTLEYHNRGLIFLSGSYCSVSANWMLKLKSYQTDPIIKRFSDRVALRPATKASR